MVPNTRFEKEIIELDFAFRCFSPLSIYSLSPFLPLSLPPFTWFIMNKDNCAFAKTN